MFPLAKLLGLNHACLQLDILIDKLSETFSKALFLDRDGIINEDFGYVSSCTNFVFKKEIFQLCRKATAANYMIIIVTNQAGIGRGYYSEIDFIRLTKWMTEKFYEQGVEISDVFFCPSHPVHGLGRYKKNDFDRKPSPGMLLKAIHKFSLSAIDSIMVGDKPTDVEAGKRAGIGTNILVSETRQHQELISSNVKVVKDIMSVLKFL